MVLKKPLTKPKKVPICGRLYPVIPIWANIPKKVLPINNPTTQPHTQPIKVEPIAAKNTSLIAARANKNAEDNDFIFFDFFN